MQTLLAQRFSPTEVDVRWTVGAWVACLFFNSLLLLS